MNYVHTASVKFKYRLTGFHSVLIARNLYFLVLLAMIILMGLEIVIGLRNIVAGDFR